MTHSLEVEEKMPLILSLREVNRGDSPSRGKGTFCFSATELTKRQIMNPSITVAMQEQRKLKIEAIAVRVRSD